MIAKISNLSRWEWFKLQRRRMLWVLLAFMLLFAQLAIWGQFFSYQNLKVSGGEVIVPGSNPQQQGGPRTLKCNDLLSGDPARQPTDLAPQIVDGLHTSCTQQAPALPERLARAYQGISLPGSIPNAIAVVQSLGLILIAILTASAIGLDYGSGTLRSVLSQGTGRWPYLVAKLATLVALAAAALLVTAASIAITSLITTSIAGPAPLPATPATWSGAALSLWKAWASFIPYIALTTAVTVLARSTAAGMAIGLGYYFGEQIISALLAGFFTWFVSVEDFLLVHNIAAFTGGFGTAAATDPTHAVVVLAIYTIAFGALAFWLFERRDVQGATGGG